MDRDTITTLTGREADITDQINRILLNFEFGLHRTSENMKFIRKFCAQLIIVAGPDAPDKILEDFAKNMTDEEEAFLRETWEPIIAEYLAE